MKREREDNTSLDLTGFPYGHKVKVYFLEYEHWYDALVTKVKADQVMVRHPTCFSK